MLIAIRVDASTAMGTGHLVRCLALGAAVRASGGEVLFITRRLDIDSPARIEASGFRVLVLPALEGVDAADVDLLEDRATARPPHSTWASVSQAVDAAQTCAALRTLPALHPQRDPWLIVDHYAFDADWHSHVAAQARVRLCVIDDLGDRPLRADVLVDHNLADDHRAKYALHESHIGTFLVGPRFALLGPSYADAPRYEFHSGVRSIGIFMGGADAGRVSTPALEACLTAHFSGPIEVVSTTANPHLDALRAACARNPQVTLALDLPNLAAFYRRHDLHIGAGGGASWERCAIGAPTLALKCAANQSVAIDGLAAAGIVMTVGSNDVASVAAAIARLIDAPGARRQLCERSRGLVDGLGASRVALRLLSDTLQLDPATQADAMVAHAWRNAPETRRYFDNPAEVDVESHLAWWRLALDRSDCHLLMARIGTRRVGSLRLDVEDGVGQIAIYLDPPLTGLGLGAAMLREGQRWVSREIAAVDRLAARIHPDNRASAAAFASAGFSWQGSLDWTWERPR